MVCIWPFSWQLALGELALKCSGPEVLVNWKQFILEMIIFHIREVKAWTFFPIIYRSITSLALSHLSSLSTPLFLPIPLSLLKPKRCFWLHTWNGLMLVFLMRNFWTVFARNIESYILQLFCKTQPPFRGLVCALIINSQLLWIDK